MLQRKMLSFLFMMIFIPSVRAQWKDSTRFINKEHEFETTYNNCSQPVGLNPLGLRQPIHKGRLRPLCNTDVYIMIHNSSKIK